MTVTRREAIKHLAKRYEAQGYRCVSRAYGTLARVDREDWLVVLQKHFRDPDFYHADADYYRRVLSEDTITIGKSIARYVASSSHDTTGYVPLAALKGREYIPQNIQQLWSERQEK